MPISVSCLDNDLVGSMARIEGFTLLELLVVLALGAAMVAVVMPRLASTVQAIQVSGDRADVARQLAALSVDARLSGKPFNLGKGESIRADFPEGWEVVVDESLKISPLGVCSDAVLVVSGPTGAEKWQLKSPDCSVLF